MERAGAGGGRLLRRRYGAPLSLSAALFRAFFRVDRSHSGRRAGAGSFAGAAPPAPRDLVAGDDRPRVHDRYQTTPASAPAVVGPVSYGAGACAACRASRAYRPTGRGRLPRPADYRQDPVGSALGGRPGRCAAASARPPTGGGACPRRPPRAPASPFASAP